MRRACFAAFSSILPYYVTNPPCWTELALSLPGCEPLALPTLLRTVAAQVPDGERFVLLVGLASADDM